MPLTTIFSRRYGPIPPIAEVREQHGEWGTVGQTRVVALKGPGVMHETLTSVNPPNNFGYTLTGITGPLGLLVDHIEGKWIFDACGWTNEETNVIWTWTIHPTSIFAVPFLPLLGRLWKGYARQSLATLSAELRR